MDIEANKRIGNVLKELRKERGLRQIGVAEKLGKPQSYISKIESGEKSLHLHEVFSYADALGAPRLELLGKVEMALTGESTVLNSPLPRQMETKPLPTKAPTKRK